jgi:hypothetical protein
MFTCTSPFFHRFQQNSVEKLNVKSADLVRVSWKSVRRKPHFTDVRKWIVTLFCHTFGRILIQFGTDDFHKDLLSDYEFRKTGTAKAINFHPYFPHSCQSQWPSGLRHGSAAVGLLGLRGLILPGAWISLSCECCVLSGRGLCVGLITRPEETNRVWCVWVWSWSLSNEEALAHWGLSSHFPGSLTNLRTIRYKRSARNAAYHKWVSWLLAAGKVLGIFLRT